MSQRCVRLSLYNWTLYNYALNYCKEVCAMDVFNASVPEIYESSADFRFFCKWFRFALSKIQYDTENLFDLYDPLRCPSKLLWMLADTMGFKYDDRLPVAFNRLVLIYFMSMIRNKGSKDGVTLAAETNLAQQTIQSDINSSDDSILNDRLEDTSIPVNSVYVTANTPEGYIDVVYFAEKVPIDACIEYVRPLGMYLFQHAGVRYDARTRISVDARLVQDDVYSSSDIGMSVGATRVGHYRREDYARLQQLQRTGTGSPSREVTVSDLSDHGRQTTWDRNSKSENTTSKDAGYRALYSLQLCNNEHVIASLLPESSSVIFGIGYGPQDVKVVYPDNKLVGTRDEDNSKPWNLLYDRATDEANGSNVRVTDPRRSDYDETIDSSPVVNLPMESPGDTVVLDKGEDGRSLTITDVNESGNISVVEYVDDADDT